MPSRDETIALVVSKATQYDLVPWEVLGGIIAESGLNPLSSRPSDPRQWQRYWEPPDPFDVSFGLGQQTVRYAPEYTGGDAYPGDDEIARIRDLYLDPVHALDVAAANYKRWRYNPEVPALTAWCAYNGGAYFYHHPDESPNRANYVAGLAEAQQILGVPMPDPVYNPNQPPERQIQSYACSIRTLTWMLKSLGINIDAGTLQDEMVPMYVTPEVGLLDGRGNGLAAVARNHLPPSVTVSVFWAPSWDDLLERAGRGPIGIGSGALYHWLDVAAPIDANTVRTANPAPNYPPGAPLGDTLTRDQFNQYAPWALVMAEASTAPVPVPTPPPSVWTVPSGVFAGMTGPELQAHAEGMVVTISDIADRLGDLQRGYAAAMLATVDQMQAEREQAIGKR